jgi:hypothetical protein
MLRRTNFWSDQNRGVLGITADAEKPGDQQIKSGKYMKESVG